MTSFDDRTPNDRGDTVAALHFEQMTPDSQTPPDGSQFMPGNFPLNSSAEASPVVSSGGAPRGVRMKPRRFKLETPAEIESRPLLGYRIKNVLPEAGVAVIYGASGSGKSFLILDAILSIAAGRHWFGYRTKSCPVAYVGLEGAAGLAQRVKAHNVFCKEDVTAGVRFLTTGLSLLQPKDVQDLADALSAAGIRDGVVVLDTLHAACPGADENSSEDMGRIIDAVKTLQAKVGGLVVLVHHTGKDDRRGPRGHSSLFAALDAAIEVTRTGTGREWSVAKSKDGADGICHGFTLATVELGTDEDGDPITSCVVKSVEGLQRSSSRSKKEKDQLTGANQIVIFKGLEEMLGKAGTQAPDGAPAELPAGRATVRLDEAVETLRGRLTVEEKRRNERVRSTILGLVSKARVVLQDDYLWLP